MGVYWHGMTRKVKMVDGKRIGLAKYFGKAPDVFCDDGLYVGRWKRFQTLAWEAAEDMRGKVDYVTYGGQYTDGTTLYAFLGGGVWGDAYLDLNYVGYLKKVGGRYTIVHGNKERVKDD